MPDAISILIVDDEPVARSRLRELLADLAPEFPHRIVAEAANAPEALSQIDLYNPQLVLLDVQMPGMTGIELARHVSARAAASETPKPMPLVIFVTAFEEFAVDAFEVRAIDYLLKPVRARRLQEALARARSLAAPAGLPDALPAPARTHFSVTERGRIVLVPVREVRFLRAELKYVTLRTATQEHVIEESLTRLEEEFGRTFVRIHRGCLVAVKHLPTASQQAHRRDGVAHILRTLTARTHHG